MIALLFVLGGWAACLFAYLVYRDLEDLIHNRVIRRAIAGGVLLALLAVGSVSAHDADALCRQGQSYVHLERAPAHTTADVRSGSTVVLDDVAGNGTYPIAPGSYSVRWSDGFVKNHLEVPPCSTPIPSPMPSAIDTPTPTATRTPTPSATSPTSIPSTRPTPSHTSSRTPSPTLPPTDTDPESRRQGNQAVMALGALLLALGALGLVFWPDRRRR